MNKVKEGIEMTISKIRRREMRSVRERKTARVQRCRSLYNDRL